MGPPPSTVTSRVLVCQVGDDFQQGQPEPDDWKEVVVVCGFGTSATVAKQRCHLQWY